MLTAVPAPNADGAAAPINQLAKMPHYVSAYFTKVVRISLNSLWTAELDRTAHQNEDASLNLFSHEGPY